jgi:predicted transposase YdaD
VLVVRDVKPWFLVEVKKGDRSFSPALMYFQRETKAAHAFQVVIDLPFEAANRFSRHQPLVVPAKTFRSHLI